MRHNPAFQSAFAVVLMVLVTPSVVQAQVPAPSGARCWVASYGSSQGGQLTLGSTTFATVPHEVSVLGRDAHTPAPLPSFAEVMRHIQNQAGPQASAATGAPSILGISEVGCDGASTSASFDTTEMPEAGRRCWMAGYGYASKGNVSLGTAFMANKPGGGGPSMVPPSGRQLLEMVNQGAAQRTGDAASRGAPLSLAEVTCPATVAPETTIGKP